MKNTRLMNKVEKFISKMRDEKEIFLYFSEGSIDDGEGKYHLMYHNTNQCFKDFDTQAELNEFLSENL